MWKFHRGNTQIMQNKPVRFFHNPSVKTVSPENSGNLQADTGTGKHHD
jgi:hypothetical protein